MSDSSKSFLGKGWIFPPEFDRERGIVHMVENEEDIRQSIRIILGTIPGERPMRPTFGCGIRQFVFESNDPTYNRKLKDTVYEALLYNEPRIKIDSIEIERSEETEGLIHLHIEYMVIITNTRSNMVYPFYLDEGTIL